jgi:hypothetical protein
MNPSAIADARVEAQHDRICEALGLSRHAVQIVVEGGCLSVDDVPCDSSVHVRLETRSDNRYSHLLVKGKVRGYGCLGAHDVLDLRGSVAQLRATNHDAARWIRNHPPSECSFCRGSRR